MHRESLRIVVIIVVLRDFDANDELLVLALQFGNSHYLKLRFKLWLLSHYPVDIGDYGLRLEVDRTELPLRKAVGRYHLKLSQTAPAQDYRQRLRMLRASGEVLQDRPGTLHLATTIRVVSKHPYGYRQQSGQGDHTATQDNGDMLPAHLRIMAQATCLGAASHLAFTAFTV